MRLWIKIPAIGIMIAAGVVTGMVGDVQLRYINHVYNDAEEIRPAPVAIVLGASVNARGEPSDALSDRLLVGEALYTKGLVEKVLITGDDGAYHVDEIKAMRAFLEARGVPPENILEDGHGYRTYESCKRARQVFGIERAIVVTQRFHLGRALYLCNRLGIEAHGVGSDLNTYRRILYFVIRDIAASIEAWWDVNVRAPRPPVSYGE